ncbi:MAG: single-stranded-DNA-specific exonuclease RecJ, partial [Clostridiales bacterium]|nr:single-stranded-DNA-specific exonuclease RecJ [Clostridiales bacterium]
MRLKCKNEHVNQRDAAMLMDALSLSPMAAQLLLQRGIDTVDAARSFLYDETLCDPFAFTQMADAVKVIKDAIGQQKHIVVYGDYDCDGISACAILVHRLTVMGADVSPYIPSRSFEGYGLNLSAMEVISKDAGLVITVDCGIGSMSEIAYLREKGIDVVLTDHHTPGDVLPNANALLNPKVQAPRGLENLCGCGMAYTLARALGAGDDDYIAICAMATIGDIVPLIGENRIIVKRGLRAMNENRPVFLKALMEEARLSYDTLGATQVAYMLVPRINAAGRMDDAMVAYHLLQTGDAAKAAEYARTLCAYNVKRQSMEEEILKEALAALKKHPPRDRRAVYAFGRGWHQGVVGIVASRLTEQFQMPAVVGSIDESGSLTASLRSVGNVNIHTALTACEDLFSRYGGHAQAGGFTMESDKIETFIERFE